MHLDNNWFTEIQPEAGLAFSLKVKEKLHEETTPFQKIEIYETGGFGKLMVIDGFTMVSSLDNFIYHEMMVHPVLFTHPDPKDVAIIGGGDCGTLKEVLKHKTVASVSQIDIDERVTRLSEKYFPELCESNSDDRARLIFDDGIAWMKNAEPESLDIIIVDSTDPIGPGEVLFTHDFYQACFKALRKDGLFIQQSESPLIHQKLQERLYKNLSGVGFTDSRSLFFPLPIYPTGWWSATMASKSGRIMGYREEDVLNAPCATSYYDNEIHEAAFAEPCFFAQLRKSWLGKKS